MNLGKVLEDAQDIDGQLSAVQTGLSAELFHIVNDEYKKETDRTFERLRSAELQGNPYEKTDYRRVAFKNEEQAAAFQSYMQEHNINAVMPSMRINGQYLVEIPKIVKIKDIQDKTGSSAPDDSLFQIKEKREEQGAEFLKSPDLLAAYYGDTGEDLDKDEYTQTDTDKQSDNNADYNKIKDAESTISSFIIGQLDGINEIYGIYQKAKGIAETFGLYDREKREEDNLFETKEHSENQRGWDEVYSPRVRSGNKETAVVLNNNIVMINGQVVTDKAVCDNILKRHRERMAKAGAGSPTAVSAPTAISAIGAAAGGDEYRKAVHREENNANIIQAQVYQQEYTVFTRTKTEGMLFHGGVMNTLTEQINTGNVVSHIYSDYHLKKEDTADTVNRMNEMFRDSSSFSSVQKELLAKVNDGLHEDGSDTFDISLSIDDRENMRHMLLQASARAYVVRGSENNAIAHLQTAMAGAGATEALSQLSETEHQNVVESLKRFARTKDENLSDTANALDVTERIVIQKLDLNPDVQLSESEEKALQSALAKQSAESTANKDFRKKADEISKLMKFDEQETLLMQAAGTEAVLQKVIDYEKAQNAYNPDYEPMKIGEMNSGDLKKYTADEVRAMGISEKEWNAANAFMQNKDKMMSNFSTLKELEKDFGIKISADEPLTRERLLKVNEAFLKRASEKGYQFVKPDGTFDVDALKALDKDQLKELGISPKTRDMLVKINTDSEWGFDIKKFSADFSQKFMSVFNKLTKDDEEMAKFRQDLNTMKKTVKYTKKSAASVYRAGKSARMFISTHRMRHPSRFSAGNSAVRSGAKTAEKAVNPAQARAVDLEANDKYARKLEKKLKRVERDENSILNRSGRWVKNQKERVQQGVISSAERAGRYASSFLSRSRAGRAVLSVANRVGNVAKGAMALTKSVTVALEAAKAAAGKYIAIGAAILLLILLLDILFLAAMMSIASLTEADYTEKVAYVLYDTLKDQETQWIADLKNADVQFSNKDRKDRGYGTTNMTFKGYVNGLAYLMLDRNDEEKLLINPFNDNIIEDADYDTNYQYLTQVEKFDGSLKDSIGVNSSIYSRRNEEDGFDSGITNLESGHTSNIKDILAMTDTLYKMDTGGMTDAVLTDIMGVTPATIDWANGANNTSTFFKWLKANTISAWFGNDDDPLRNVKLSDALAENGTCSYGAIESYVFSLWQSSHQERLFLQTEFYPLAPDEINIPNNNASGWRNIRTNLKQPQASELGYCVDPVTNKFPIFWVDGLTAGNHISPYIETTDEEGNKAKHSTAAPHSQNNGYAIEVTMQNLKEDETPCLWESMANDEDTWNSIVSHSCWEKSDDESGDEDIIGSTFTSNTHTSTTGGDGIPDAFAAEQAKNKAVDERNAFYSDHKESWTLSDDKNKMTHIWYENDNDYAINYAHKTSGNFNGEYSFWEADEYGIEDLSWTEIDGHYYWQARYRIKKHIEVYTRNCKGHDFQYCGGHVNIHTQGVVYSATNEQMTMAGVADPAPVAMKLGDEEYKPEDHGYDTLRGKMVDINYETFAATQANHVSLPKDDPQGSYVAQQVGLNLWRSEDGEQWVAAGSISGGDAETLLENNVTDADKNENIKRSGIQVASNGISTHFIRDIFDVDCLLLKAKNIFPCRSYKDYEGWTADNMQLALMKLSTDWTDMYGFEVPLEIGDKWVDESEETPHTTSGYTLSQKDVSTVMDLLDKQYGELMSEERKKAAELALSWVGRGHYSEYHTTHDFLYKAVTGMSKTLLETKDDGSEGEVEFEKANITASSTASDNIGFINYIYNASGAYSSYFDYRKSLKIDENGNIGDLGSTYWDGTASLPCDLLVRKYFEPLSKKAAYLRVDIGDSEWNDEKSMELLRKYRGTDAVIYIGIFDEATLGGSELKLSGGQTIHAGVPVTIDMAEIHGIGNIYLHTEEPTDITDLNGDTNYWWVIPKNRIGKYSSVERMELGQTLS